MPFVLSIFALSCRRTWVNPLWIYPSRSSSTLSLALSLFLHLLSSRISVAGLLLIHFLASRLAIFFWLELAIKLLPFLLFWLVSFVLSSICGIWCTNAHPIVLFPCTSGNQQFLSSGQRCPYCSVSYLELVVSWDVFYQGVSKYLVDFSFCPKT